MDDNSDSNDSQEKQDKHEDAATNIVRAKLGRLYSKEPDAKDEIHEVEALDKQTMSRHQKFMDELSKSGRSLAEIQTAWHEYYAALPDKDKHEVWHEFYANHEKRKIEKKVKQAQAKTTPKPRRSQISHQTPAVASGPEIENPKEDLLRRIARKSSKNKRSAHAHSLLFGLGVGLIVTFILMFTFFNERFITPFIRPSVNVSATPIIVDPNDNGPVGPESKIIIPKINVEAPVVYDIPTIDDKTILEGLDKGAIHYPTTSIPGENGNAVFFGHSSSNIFNKGKYKFVFILLKSLENGDTFIIQKDGKRYVYKIYNKYVTNPKDVSVLNPPSDGRTAIATLITCDPPGLSTNRLIVQAEQIFPDPAKNKPSSVGQSAANTKKPAELPSNAPSLWSRLIDAIFH